MKKTVFVLLSLFILTGCEVNYNLTIENDRVIESSDFILDKNDENEKTLDSYYNTSYQTYYDMDSMKDYNYKKKMINSKNKIGMNLSYIYRGQTYQYSSMLDKCYYKKSFTNSDKYIILFAEGGASCFYQDENKLIDRLNVNIKTDLNVLDSNADKVEGNTYIWNLDKDNFSDKEIYIKIKKSNKSSYIPLIVICVIILVVVLIFKRIVKVNEKINKL